MKRIFFVFMFCMIPLTNLLATDHPGFYVQGRHLYDKCGEKVVLRGINKMIIWRDKDGDPSFKEIAKTGANVARIVWTTKGKPAELDTVIARCWENKMIPIIECHDATGDWSKLGLVIQYWIDPQIVRVIQKHQDYLLLNIANECGNDVPADTFRLGYQQAILKMRDAGIHVPLIIDASVWGHEIDMLQSQGPALIVSDPDHNLMFSIHMWWPLMWGFDAQRVIDELQESVDLDLPLIVGEFGNQWDESEQGAIPYKTILRECQKHDIGWLAWSWGPGNNPQTFLDMTTDGNFDSLYGWGKEVAITDSFSIANTSIKSKFIKNGRCD